ncbi:hypothetical protein C8F01DRAFT_1165825 [Mycena amicta]|nr:hypothetical protein C8F01DRAFT_1165825 [Mycena amicta]
MGGGPGHHHVQAGRLHLRKTSTGSHHDHVAAAQRQCTGTMPAMGVGHGAPRLRPIALPSQLAGVTSVTLHPLLGRPTCVRISLANDALGLSAQWLQRPASLAKALQAPATYPALPSLTLVVAELPWVITVHSQGQGQAGFGVTVGDVLCAIRDALRLDVDEMQFDDWRLGLEMTPGGRDRPTEYRPGMTRADLLAGRTMFGGLWLDSDSDLEGCDIWTLELEDSLIATD